MNREPNLYWILLIPLWTSEGAEVVVEEGRDFVLECSWPNVDLTGDVFFWDQDGARRVFEYDAGLHPRNGQDPRFCGRVSHFPESLRDGNASVQVRAARISDSGNYTCYFQHEASGRSGSTRVAVGASPKPRLRVMDSRRLLCEVDGAFPEPRVEFLDGSGARIPAEDLQTWVEQQRCYVRASVHVSTGGNYTCVVTQEQIHRRTSTTTFVPTCEGNPGWMGAFWALLVVLVLAVSTIVLWLIRIKRRPGPQDGEAAGSNELRVPALGTSNGRVTAGLPNGCPQAESSDRVQL